MGISYPWRRLVQSMVHVFAGESWLTVTGVTGPGTGPGGFWPAGLLKDRSPRFARP